MSENELGGRTTMDIEKEECKAREIEKGNEKE